MPLTRPEEYPENPRGLDERDADNRFFSNIVPRVVNITRPIGQKVIKDGLWVETVMILLILITGVGETFTTFSSFWYGIVGVFTTLFVLKMSKVHFSAEEEEVVETRVEVSEEGEDENS